LTLLWPAIKLELFPAEQDFNHLIQRYQSAHAVLMAVRERLASARASRPEEVLDAVVTSLFYGRGYPWIGIYFAIEGLGVRQASSGPAPAGMGLVDVKSEVAVPIRLGTRTLGLIVAESGRPSGASQERALLQQVAKIVAQYLTTDRAKQLLRKTREKARAEAGAEQPSKSPQSARPAVRKAAAGGRILR
jgi:hypothetical protein